jgi:hypothetical protein
MMMYLVGEQGCGAYALRRSCLAVVERDDLS